MKKSFFSLPLMSNSNVRFSQKLVAAALLFLWCAMTSLTYVGLYQRLEAWRQWRWTKLAQGEFDSQLEVFTFSVQEWASVTKLEDGREMEWQGKLYDIASVAATEQSIVVRALQDQYEYSLNETLKQCSDRPNEELIPVGWWTVYGIMICPQICQSEFGSFVLDDGHQSSLLVKPISQNHLDIPHLPPCAMV
jgi:hypothetical protein